jgi:hypothetical protein
MKATPSIAFSLRADNAYMRVGSLNCLRDPAMHEVHPLATNETSWTSLIILKSRYQAIKGILCLVQIIGNSLLYPTPYLCYSLNNFIVHTLLWK